MGSRRLNLITITVALLVGCSSDSMPPEPQLSPPRALTASEAAIVNSQLEFGINLLKELSQSEPDTNLFISPLSVSMAVGMTMNGANGATREALENVLALHGLSSQQINESYRSLIDLLHGLDPAVTMEIANSIWYRHGFAVERGFTDLAAMYFNADIRDLNFDDPQSVKVINGWVNAKTREKIPAIIDNIDPETVMFLINALYFKGTWTFEFDPKQTQEGQFRSGAGIVNPCNFMNQHGEFDYYKGDGFQMVDLPYGNRAYSMSILLPDEGSATNAILAKLTPQAWSTWVEGLAPLEMDLSLPKFKQEYSTSLKSVLEAMGMEIAFDPAAADFSHISTLGRLFIQDVKHKTLVEVDEKGTVAAAVTGVVVGITSVPSYLSLVVDRPFLFAIRDSHSNAIIFVGKIVRPNS